MMILLRTIALFCFIPLAASETSLRGNGRSLAVGDCTAADDCHRNGVCVEGSCQCALGTTGDGYWSCLPINECITPPLACTSEGMYCVDHDLPLRYSCGCKVGWEKVLPGGWYFDPDVPKELRPESCADVDECTSEDPQYKKCDTNAECTNTAGSYSCACAKGFSGDGFECERDPIETAIADPDPCDAQDCDFHKEKCVTDKNRTVAWCECKQGYFSPSGRGGNCQDRNECEETSDDCHRLADCTNNLGGFTCACRSGYSGNGTYCQDIDECTTGALTCDEGYICHNTIGDAFCALDTEVPSASPSTPFPSGMPSVTPFCSNPSATTDSLCGVEETPFGCSCDNTCGVLNNCCPDYEAVCATYADFATRSVDTVFVSDGFDESYFGFRRGIMRCNGTFIGRGISTGCGFNLNFNTMGHHSHLSCDCLELEMIDPSGVDFGPPSSVKVFYNGVLALSLPTTTNTSFASGKYAMECGIFGDEGGRYRHDHGPSKNGETAFPTTSASPSLTPSYLPSNLPPLSVNSTSV